MQGCSLTRTAFERLHNQLSHVWKEHETTTNWQLVSFSGFCSPFAEKSLTGRRNFRNFQFIRKKNGWLSPNQLKVVHMNDITVAEDLLRLNNLLYDIDIVSWNKIEELARRSAQKHGRTAGLLRYNDHICYVSKINAVFQSFSCPTCNAFFIRTFTLERQLTTCTERVKQYLFENCIWKSFDRLASSGIKYPSQLKLFENLESFDCEIICVPDKTMKGTKTTTWIRQHLLNSVCMFSNDDEEPIFLCNSDPHHIVSSSIGATEDLASQIAKKSTIDTLVVDVEATTFQIKLGSISEKIPQRHKRQEQVRRFDTNQDDCGNETCASTEFLQIRKNQLIQLQEHLERYGNVLYVFGFNGAIFDLYFIKSYLVQILVNERDIEPAVIKKANQFISLKLGDIQLFKKIELSRCSNKS